ncbi:glutamate-1-semialdehyde 2,1-aminomutase [Desulfosoma caldarium]|uniref:Glutamate-1-semialdehyde 2,1-aminomutase n=1 Tax=Desulfosoma caldarium TaxID=610254 RepID=A0A3N1UN49_9BACT|nr:glutamate-1-semialdehyde 2,1-aminomutase [Desulfosoma caldarium]ROQ91168.1 glutamate-1-semialdehyde 2,1-aminomutase [Desulfosoma caldarium]
MVPNTISERLFHRAQAVIPGGVNSPVRSCRSVGTTPFFVKRALGCRLEDEDGRIYLDYVGSWGPLILGHAHPRVVEAVRFAATQGTSYGIPCRMEVELAEKVVSMVPSMEMVRMVNSGTEATMSAIRLARGYTGRPKVIKFDGCYHGHSDGLLVKGGSGLATLGIPGSPGVPPEVVAHTLSLPYNDLDAVETALKAYGETVACIIVEPVAGNMGTVIPKPEFLPGLRRLCDTYGSLLIFDEVITGFRLAPGGAQERFAVRPDLTCLGKIIGGGLPVGAYGGRRDIMEKVAPLGDVYQAGTLSGNPLAMAAGFAMLQELSEPGIYESLEKKGEALEAGLREAARLADVPLTINRIGSMGTAFFTDKEVSDFASALQANTAAYGVFYREMLARGVYLAPSQFESFFVSTAHDREDLDRTAQAALESLRVVKTVAGSC